MTDISTTLAPEQGRPSPLTYKGVRVMTTAVAAKEFGATEKQLQDNFANNEARFEEGKHFYKVTHGELRAIKNHPDYIGLVHKKASHLILWTERGIARHAKILETETAWAIFEQLEDTYFRVKEERAAQPAPVAAKFDVREARLSFANFMRIGRMLKLDGNQVILSANRATRNVTGVDMLAAMGATHLTAPTQHAALTPTTMGQQLGGMSGQAVNQALCRHGYQASFRDAKNHLVYEATEKGRSVGGHLTDTGKHHGSGRPVMQLMWTTQSLEALRVDIQSENA